MCFGILKTSWSHAFLKAPEMHGLNVLDIIAICLSNKGLLIAEQQQEITQNQHLQVPFVKQRDKCSMAMLYYAPDHDFVRQLICVNVYL